MPTACYTRPEPWTFCKNKTKYNQGKSLYLTGKLSDGSSYSVDDDPEFQSFINLTSYFLVFGSPEINGVKGKQRRAEMIISKITEYFSESVDMDCVLQCIDPKHFEKQSRMVEHNNLKSMEAFTRFNKAFCEYVAEHGEYPSAYKLAKLARGHRTTAEKFLRNTQQADPEVVSIDAPEEEVLGALDETLSDAQLAVANTIDPALARYCEYEKDTRLSSTLLNVLSPDTTVFEYYSHISNSNIAHLYGVRHDINLGVTVSSFILAQLQHKLVNKFTPVARTSAYLFSMSQSALAWLQPLSTEPKKNRAFIRMACDFAFQPDVIDLMSERLGTVYSSLQEAFAKDDSIKQRIFDLSEQLEDYQAQDYLFDSEIGQFARELRKSLDVQRNNRRAHFPCFEKIKSDIELITQYFDWCRKEDQNRYDQSTRDKIQEKMDESNELLGIINQIISEIPDSHKRYEDRSTYNDPEMMVLARAVLNLDASF